MSKYSEKLLGYTLVELLVGLVIISILFGVGFAGFRDFSRRQSLESLSRKIKGDLSLARENAVSGTKPLNDFGSGQHEYFGSGQHEFCISPNILFGYNFKVVSNSNYVLEAFCSGGTVEVKNINIPEELNISIPSTNPLFFQVLSKGTNLSSDLEIIINQETTGKTRSIFVTKTGEIK